MLGRGDGLRVIVFWTKLGLYYLIEPYLLARGDVLEIKLSISATRDSRDPERTTTPRVQPRLSSSSLIVGPIRA